MAESTKPPADPPQAPFVNGPQAARELFANPDFVRELRKIAEKIFGSRRPGHTLSPTALINEAYLRMNGQSAPCLNKAHFFALAAKAMFRALVDHARGKCAAKRGGNRHSDESWKRVSFDVAEEKAASSPEDVLRLAPFLEEFEAVDERAACVVQLRYGFGLTEQEIAQELGISEGTVQNDWAMARVWLQKRVHAATTPIK